MQSSLSEPGRRGGFKWTPDAMTREEVAALAVVVDSVSDRLEMLLDALKRSDDDPAEVAAELAGEIETADNKADRAREQLAKDFLKVFNAEEKRKQRRR